MMEGSITRAFSAGNSFSNIISVPGCHLGLFINVNNFTCKK